MERTPGLQDVLEKLRQAAEDKDFSQGTPEEAPAPVAPDVHVPITMDLKPVDPPKVPGKPRRFPTPEHLAVKVAEYFEHCKNPPAKIKRGFKNIKDPKTNQDIIEDGELKQEEYMYKFQPDEIPPTIAGLCWYLEITRDMLTDFRKGAYGQGYSNILNKTFEFMESWWAERLASTNATGPLFTLKAQFGWKDTEDGPLRVLDVNTLLDAIELRKQQRRLGAAKGGPKRIVDATFTENKPVEA